MFCPFLMVEVIETTSLLIQCRFLVFTFLKSLLQKDKCFSECLLQKKLWKMETKTIKIFLNNLILVYKQAFSYQSSEISQNF